MSRALAFFAALMAILALAFACAKSTPVSARDPADGGTPIDTDVMAYLSEARALHHEANLKEDARDLPGAVAALDRLVHARTPREGAHIPEVEEVLADTYARMAELELRMHDMGAADQAIRAGLDHAPEPTYFRGHLVEVRGIIEEARAAELADAGRTAEATAARTRAMDLLNQAVNIQEQVVARSVGAGDGGADGAAP